jgi:hypothetical protein
MRFDEYYRELQVREGNPVFPLIHSWPSVLRDSVEQCIRSAVSGAHIIGSVCPIPPGTTNQAIGNKVEKFAVERLSTHLGPFRFEKCKGAGYPDQMMVGSSTHLSIPLEIKATSEWDPKDSNRVVLTSSSEKIRAKFKTPVHHLLMTIVYSETTGGACVIHVRLDFLEPETLVNVRLEASVSQQLLSVASTHHSVVLS